MKLIDLINVTYQFHEFYKYKEVKSREVFIFQAKVLKFGDLLVGGSWQQIQNSSATSPNFMPVNPKKKQGDVGMNSTIIIKANKTLITSNRVCGI